MNKILSLLKTAYSSISGSGYILYIICAIAGAGAGAYVTYNITSLVFAAKLASINTTIATQEANQSKTALNNFVTASQNIHDNALAFDKLQASLETNFARISEDLKNAEKHPLPTGCYPDSARVLVLNDAIKTVNASIKPESSP